MRATRATTPTPAESAAGTDARRRGRGWLAVLAVCAAVGALVAAVSNRSASYEERLLDVHARQTLGAASYRAAAGAAPMLQAVLLDAASDPELGFKMRLALQKYGHAARAVLEAYGSEAPLHELLRRYGESVVPVIAYFMDNDVAALRAGYQVSRLAAALKAHAGSMFAAGDNHANGQAPAGAHATGAPPAPIEYGPDTRGRYAIGQIGSDGYRFLAQFSIDAAGVAHWNQTDRALKSVEDFLFGGIRNLEAKYDTAAPIGVLDVADAGADLLTVFGIVKSIKLLRAAGASAEAAKAAPWAALSEYRALLGRRVLAGGGRLGSAALKLGATAGAVYLVVRHPGLLTSLFVEAGVWLGLPAWAAAAAGWWMVAFALAMLLLPVLAVAGAVSPLLTRIAESARWLLGWRHRTATTRPLLPEADSDRHADEVFSRRRLRWTRADRRNPSAGAN